jgi:hypothetical protein
MRGRVAVARAAGAAEPLATCFWEGPISTKQRSTGGFDGRYFNFPEESATYWLARVRLPPGGRLMLRGRFAYARYQSINAYSDGAPTDALADFEIRPDPGSTNPFLTGGPRNRRARAYTVTVLNAQPPGDPAGRQPNTIYAAPERPDSPIELLYRVYEPNRGRDLTGGTGLPKQDRDCGEVNDSDRSIPVDDVPPETWRAAVSSPGCDRDTNPAYSPVRWERFFNLEFATQGVILECTDAGRELRRREPAPQRGGFYSNRDIAYVFAHLSRNFAPVVLVRATLPRVPRTLDGQRRLGRGQLRYWSLCTGESRVTTRTPDCLADRQVPVGRSRRYTIAVSQAADRPRNAAPGCGLAWLDWGDRGDGAGNPNYGVLIMRNMLPSPDFQQAIQRIPRLGTEQQVMGPYFPQATYTSKAAVESLGCRRSRLSLRGRRLRARRRGRVRVRVRCRTPETRCRGTLRLATPRGRSLGTGRFSISAGRGRRVLVRLNRAGRRVARGRSRVVRVRARGSTPAGVGLRAVRRYTLPRG